MKRCDKFDNCSRDNICFRQVLNFVVCDGDLSRKDHVLAIRYIGFMIIFDFVSMEEEPDWKLMLFDEDQNTSYAKTQGTALFV